MTESTRLRRRRRGTTSDNIPAEIAAWFAGERAAGWLPLLEPERSMVWPCWRLWLSAHPDAVPPADGLPELFRPPAATAASTRKDEA